MNRFNPTEWTVPLVPSPSHGSNIRVIEILPRLQKQRCRIKKEDLVQSSKILAENESSNQNPDQISPSKCICQL